MKFKEGDIIRIPYGDHWSVFQVIYANKEKYDLKWIGGERFYGTNKFIWTAEKDLDKCAELYLAHHIEKEIEEFIK